MVCGISMLIGLAELSGVIDMISGVISENVSTKAIQPLLIAIGSLLSFVTNGISGVLIPFTPMLPSISEATGVSTTTLFACIGTSVSLTCLSPFSMGGSFILGFADHADQKKLMVQQIILAIVVAALGVILSFTGLYSILG